MLNSKDKNLTTLVLENAMLDAEVIALRKQLEKAISVLGSVCVCPYERGLEVDCSLHSNCEGCWRTSLKQNLA